MSKSSKRQAVSERDPGLERLIELMDELWTALAAGDLLRAEIATARRCGVPLTPDIDQGKSDAILIGMAREDGKQEGAALLRLITQLGSPAARRRARDVLGELTARGVYPASWVTEAGKAVPVRASRVYDRYGDWEDVSVTYRYSTGEHTLIARITLVDRPAVRILELTEDEPDLTAGRPSEAAEGVSLAAARARLEPALRRSQYSVYSLRPEFGALLPIAKSRIRRLPLEEPTAPDEPSAAGEPARYTADDRAALVRDFLVSSPAAEVVAADESAARFWAEILTAWSSRLAGHPPLQAGPLTLCEILLSHVPVTYPVTQAQFAHMEASVTAWARWSAARRDLPEEHMLGRLPQALGSVSFLYHDPDSAARRAYVADVVTAGMDIAELRKIRDARAIVIPPAEDDDDERDHVDVSDADARAAYLARQFGECGRGDDRARDDFLGAVRQVAEEVWSGEPAGTRDRALALLAAGHLDEHEIMHELARSVTRRPG